jgi:hypothetical protein
MNHNRLFDALGLQMSDKFVYTFEEIEWHGEWYDDWYMYCMGSEL